MDIFLNQLIQFHLNNTINLCHLTRRVMSRYTHKMATVGPYGDHRLCGVISPSVLCSRTDRQTRPTQTRNTPVQYRAD